VEEPVGTTVVTAGDDYVALSHPLNCSVFRSRYVLFMIFESENTFSNAQFNIYIFWTMYSEIYLWI